MKIRYKVQTKSQALIRKAEMLLIKSCCYIASAEAKCGWSFNIVEMTNMQHMIRLLYVFKRQGNV